MHMRWMLAASALAISTSAFGQEQAPAMAAPLASTPGPNTLGDIVVTARRRSETLQSVPIAVTAFGSETLRQKSINTQEDLVQHTPGLMITSGAGQRSNGDFFIRGQGSTFGSLPGVITYFNEVPAYNNTIIGNDVQFYDLENVQVLKGPQGTLFGASTTGGAVLLTSKKPTNDIDGFVEGRFGNYQYGEVTGALNLPIINDKLLLRIAGNVVRRNGYTVSALTGEDYDNRNRESYRISLLLKPIDGLENLTIFRGEHVDENGSGNILSEFNPNFTVQGIPAYNPNSPITKGVIGQICGGAIFVFHTQTGTVPACAAQRLAALGNLTAQAETEIARVNAGGSIRLNSTAGDDFVRGKTQQLTNITTIRAGSLGVLGEITVKNIFATNRVGDQQSSREVTGLPAMGSTALNGLNIVNGVLTAATSYDKRNFLDNFSNEFQVQGHSKPLDWTVGYYYNREKIPFSPPTLFSTFADALDYTTPFGLPALQGAFKVNQRTIDKGVFGQTTVRLLDKLSVTAGLRESYYSITSQSAPEVYTASGIVPGATSAVNPVSEKATSYNFAIDYKPMRDMLIYATTRRGFKPGGANSPQTPAPAGYVASYSPETLTDYEVGVKYSWRGPIAGRVAIDGFYGNYQNIQRSETLSNGAQVFTQVNNIAAGRIEGIEFESDLRFSARLSLGITGAYTDAKYTNFPGTTTQAVTNLIIPNINAPFVNTPKFQFTINARYTLLDKAALGQVAISGNYYHQSSDILDDSYLQDPLHLGFQKAYGTFNLRLDWSNVLGRNIDLFANATNVTNVTYKVAAVNLMAALGAEGLIYNEPRMVSGGVRIRF